MLMLMLLLLLLSLLLFYRCSIINYCVAVLQNHSHTNSGCQNPCQNDSKWEEQRTSMQKSQTLSFSCPTVEQSSKACKGRIAGLRLTSDGIIMAHDKHSWTICHQPVISIISSPNLLWLSPKKLLWITEPSWTLFRDFCHLILVGWGFHGQHMIP